MWRIGAAALSLVLLAAPAAAQKQGGTATLGLELDIPGLDQLKVGVYDTAALFWVVIAVMAAVAVITVWVARRRRWI